MMIKEHAPTSVLFELGIIVVSRGIKGHNVTRPTTEAGKNIATTECSRNFPYKSLHDQLNITTKIIIQQAYPGRHPLLKYWLFVVIASAMINYKEFI